MNTYEQLRKKVYEILYPDGIPLNKGVEVIYGSDFGIEPRVVELGLVYQVKDKKVTNIWVPDDTDYLCEVLGKPLSLQDVLRAMTEVSEWTQEIQIHESNLFYIHDKYEDNPIIINLSKPISEQSEETLKGLLELIS